MLVWGNKPVECKAHPWPPEPTQSFSVHVIRPGRFVSTQKQRVTVKGFWGLIYLKESTRLSNFLGAHSALHSELVQF